MSRVIDMNQYDTLTTLRGKVTAAISAGNGEETYRTIGLVQGYLMGLFVAGEIDVHFLMNARKASNVH